jgi:uncharacterized protein (UPF0332 family)
MHDELLEQARHLANLDRRRPRQVNLRRAVSAAYYSLFHFLVDQACRAVMGSQQQRTAHRQVLGRAFNHGTMKKACKSFSGSTLPTGVSKGLPATFVIPADIRLLANAFRNLQEKRHLADYDLTRRFTRSEVLGLIRQAEGVITNFRRLPASNEKQFFLACLWAWSELERR